MHKKIMLFSLLAGMLALGGAELYGNKAVAAGKNTGTDTCKDCHAEQVESFMKSRHAKGSITGPNGKGVCLTCHGPNLAGHVEKGGGKGTGAFTFAKKADPKAKAAQCLTCHSSSKHLALWESSKHKSAGLSCDSCHTGHSSLAKNLKMPQTELCFSCHKDIKSEASRQSHHPIKEGKISCSDCHDPHGSFSVKNLKADSVNELCYKCHAEKRGPYMYEHPPVEENCMNCHTAHGSNHNKLLSKKVPLICQSCHDWSNHPGTPYTQSNSFKGSASGRGAFGPRSCQNCHTSIHGSNGPNTLGLRYIK